MQALVALCALPEPPTAIVAADDGLAMIAIERLQEMGVRIPEDISVTGFDDTPLASLRWSGGLTTIRQPFRTIARTAGERLISWLDGAPFEQSRVTLPAQLAVRGSTARCRSGTPLSEN